MNWVPMGPQLKVSGNRCLCALKNAMKFFTAKVFLEENPQPTEEAARAAISSNLCRCTGYHHIVKSIVAVGRKEAEG